MATLAEYQAKQKALTNVTTEGEGFNFGSEDSNWLASMAAGVPSGIFKIFEGVATLGATLMDLGVDKDRADSVEAFFDKINPLEEIAEHFRKEQERKEKDHLAWIEKRNKEADARIAAKKAKEEAKKSRTVTPKTYNYKYDTDPLGYQTGDMPRENWFRDRDDY